MRKVHPILKAHSETGFPVWLQAESPSRFSESAKLKFAKRQLSALPHLSVNRASILCHYLSVDCRGVGEIAPVIGLGRNNSAIAARHQPI